MIFRSRRGYGGSADCGVRWIDLSMEKIMLVASYPMEVSIEHPNRWIRILMVPLVFPWVLVVGFPCILLMFPLLILQLFVITWRGK